MDKRLTRIMGKSKLTEEEMKIFIEKIESIDKKQDHSNAYRTMSNEMRREILNFIGYEVRSIEKMKVKFNLDADQLKYHLSMLEHSLYVVESSEGWKSTPRGIGFMENAQLEDS